MAQNNTSYTEEKILSPSSGFPALILSILLLIAATAGLIIAAIALEKEFTVLSLTAVIVTGVYLCLPGWVPFSGLKIIRPNEAAVYTLFGRYYGTIAKSGFFWINPFCSMFAPEVNKTTVGDVKTSGIQWEKKQKVSLKATTLDNARQKINDRDGNPIDIGVVVIWRVINATKAVFEVDNYRDYISTQADAAIRHTVRMYPYDISDEGDEKSLRGSSGAVTEELKRGLQERVAFAGIEILEARISHLAYAQEIAAAMLQRQQADALIAAKQKIVEGAVGMVEMALNKLSENQVVALDEERKAAMVSNLLVVLCGNRDAQPIVNSGSIY
ncbi:MAG: SPFH domain-containing protein [Oscillospiraceae bacterium]|jgi:regulator of protease activity HflC (stomatin/prohibitin superfamily)|nr:SPFH domain-containing protein [Oscillospiraceae bacterium]